MTGTAHTLAEVEAAVAARLSEPVDGSGLLMAERAQQLAEALAQGKVEQLAHELGNVLVPLRLFAVRLAASALPTDPDGDVFTSAVRVLVAVERLSALHTASCRVADEQARGEPPIFPAPMPGVYVTNQAHDSLLVEGTDAEKLKVMGDTLLQTLEPDANAFAMRSQFRSEQRIPDTALSQPESRFGREPATKVEFITAPGTIDERALAAIRAKEDAWRNRPVQGAESDVARDGARVLIQSPQARTKHAEYESLLPVLDYIGNEIRHGWRAMSGRPPPEPAMQNLPIRPEPPGRRLRVSGHFRASLPPIHPVPFDLVFPPKDDRPFIEQIRECLGLAKDRMVQSTATELTWQDSLYNFEPTRSGRLPADRPNEGNTPKKAQADDPDASGAGSWATGCFPDGWEEK